MVTVKLRAQFGLAIAHTAFTAGTFTNATATIPVDAPLGQVSVLDALANFALPQLASLLPNLNGEPADRIMLAGAWGQPSAVSVITKSGREIPLEKLSFKDQFLLAQAFGALKGGS